MYKDMKEFLKEELKRDAEEALQRVQNDPELKNMKAPAHIKERLFAEIDARENVGKARVLTEEEEKLIEIGRLYMRRRKRYKYLVVAAVLVLAMAFGVTALGGPKKLVEDIRRMMMGRTQVEIDVDSKNIEPISEVDEETGFQMVKDKWGVDPVRMQYYLEGVSFGEFRFNEILQMAQFVYLKGEEHKIVYQIMPGYGTSSYGADMEDEPLQEYIIEVKGQEVNVKEYFVQEESMTRWLIDFSCQNMQYFIWITDETQSNVEKIVESLNFF